MKVLALSNDLYNMIVKEMVDRGIAKTAEDAEGLLQVRYIGNMSHWNDTQNATFTEQDFAD